jgi:hypothetical protein
MAVTDDHRQVNITAPTENAIEWEPQKSSITTDPDQFLKIRLSDVNWRVNTRKMFAWCLLVLLFLQNLAVFGITFTAYFQNRLQDLSLIFSVLVSATLVETAFSIKIIVEWLFKDIDYSSTK